MDIRQFLVKKPRLEDEHDSPREKSDQLQVEPPDEVLLSQPERARVSLKDVAAYCGKKLNDNEKYELLVDTWVPDETFKFPTSSNRNLKFQLSWLRSFQWLAYSAGVDGAYCKYCIAFSRKSVGKGSHQTTNAFVDTPFKNWKKALETFKEHQEKQYHKDACIDAQNFQRIFENQKGNIMDEIDVGRKRTQLENRRKLTPIIRAVLLCGRQGFALRGHRDNRPISKKTSGENEGNFRALIRFALECGNVDLKRHLDSASLNATYLSPKIQNEIIHATGKIITNKLVERINKSRCFVVIADETMDVSGIEQFSICARYIEKSEEGHRLREDFLCFTPVKDTTGKGLGNSLLTTLDDLKVESTFMVGQGYDGARAMSGIVKGCAVEVQKSHPQAVYLHCANHSLNLAITHACGIPPIRNCIGTIKTVVNFFRQSSKAGVMLEAIIKSHAPDAKRTRLIKFCVTRWVEHLDSLQLFDEVYEYICLALEKLDDTITKVEGVQPDALLTSIQKPQFIIALTVLVPIFRLTKNLSQILQKKDCDLSVCVKYANDLLVEMQDMRSDADATFESIFKAATETAEKAGVSLSVPRVVGRQTKRDNYTGGPEEYYRQSIFIPFLDHYCDELQSRFIQHRGLLSQIQNILPSKCDQLDFDKIKSTVKCFETQWPNDISSTEEFQAEMKMWRRHCLTIPKDERQNTFIEALDKCSQSFYPTIHRYLQISATLPVSVATSERSFSSLRRLKTYLRNTMGQERLNGLALLNIHQDVEVTPQEVLDVMAKSARKMDILL